MQYIACQYIYACFQSHPFFVQIGNYIQSRYIFEYLYVKLTEARHYMTKNFKSWIFLLFNQKYELTLL